MIKKGYLVLENGQILVGDSFGYEADVKGELVFNTGMVGYPEGLTDPSYYGQILVNTYPLIGNYGIPKSKTENGLDTKFESDRIQIRGLIVSEYIQNNTHWDSQSDLSTWLKSNKVPGLSGIDTRSLTKTLREKGVMKCIIKFSPSADEADSFLDINEENLVPFVSVKKPQKYGSGKIKVLFIDCGLKLNQIRIMLNYNTTVVRVPWDYNPFKENNPPRFDTVFISNGPGDARTMPQTIETVKESMKRKIPTFGICLGHQIVTLAAGGDIFKLKYGHRGQNQPVIDHSTGRAYITSQNHGFSAVAASIPKDWRVWFTNLNDNTNEGIHHKSLPFFCVQFHPEAAPGPVDTGWLFDYYFDFVKRWLKI